MAIRHLGPARETRVVSDDGTELHVEVRGPASGPTVVFSHCWATSLASWGPVVRLLDEDLRVVLYDQRGHGRTPVPLTPAGYGEEKLADDLCAVLAATVPDGERAVVAGHSMGGMTVMAAGDREVFREKAAAVLLTNTGCTQLTGRTTAIPLPKVLGRSAAAAFTLRAPLPLGPRNPATTAALKFIAMSPGADPRMVRLCARMVHACNPVARGRWGDMMNRLDLDATVRAISAPTVVVAGAEDRMTPPWHAHHIASLVQDCAEVVEVPGAGHMGPLEFPDVLADRVGKLAANHLGASPAR
ncbi:alpha/beta fold hydrolase [Nocardiopsis changdeensis]|uniref:Alpha/beta fold hydrolase n=1 Tax=Nocardiopsis changdeensis TaxID=2831969 RepID=A0ABX8BIU9_9ACTN|nr:MULTISPECIES: alpha/beta hydrolase [Nocardiopsis]QUX21655.1 alpha/beta fold hydrolase [Nocardiopsis changdeensis]QYX37589.1 alpha/beta hydrolase [Nocardiopsis sp. MT53]